MAQIFDVFNGDADGICALLQWRLAAPKESQLISGVKRDIALLSRVQARAGDCVNVFDISFKTNRADVQRLLAQDVQVFYCDHHTSGEIPTHKALTTIINPQADVCTSLLINGYLHGQFALWAIVGAFGDNLLQSAQAVAKTQALSASSLQHLAQLGLYLNYNAYGESLADLHIHPVTLYKKLVEFASPLDFISHDAALFLQLEQAYLSDWQEAKSLIAHYQTEYVVVYILPDAAWARRVSGVFANHLTQLSPNKAHAVLTKKNDAFYQVSVRAPLSNKQGANRLCEQFASGGGREAAAGINALAEEKVRDFIDLFADFYARH